MIPFRGFIRAIHDAVLSANDTLMRKNLKLLEQYFEDSQETARIKEALQKATEIADKLGEAPTKEQLEDAKKAFQDVKNALSYDVKDADSTDFILNTQTLTPRTVKIQYPDQTDNGMVIRDVNVPLITMVPLSMSQVTMVRFKTKLEMQEVDGQLRVSFPLTTSLSHSEQGETNPTVDTSNLGELEIVIEPNNESSGLRKIVEGYEKALRAQIPH